jgi:hypothetical protein
MGAGTAGVSKKELSMKYLTSISLYLIVIKR